MPPFDLLLLPLLGGFIFVTNWAVTRYSPLRSAGYRLVFFAAIAGAAFLFLSSLVIQLAFRFSFGDDLAQVWHDFAPQPHTGKAVGSFILGSLSWTPLNALGRFQWFSGLSDKAAVDRSISQKRDPMEMLLRRALGSASTIAVTLKNGKVYVGRVAANLNPAFDLESIQLHLQRSGYRKSGTHELILSIDYEKTHSSLLEDFDKEFDSRLIRAVQEDPAADNLELVRKLMAEMSTEAKHIGKSYEVVIPIAEILSVSIFDLDLFDKVYRRGKIITSGANSLQKGQLG